MSRGPNRSEALAARKKALLLRSGQLRQQSMAGLSQALAPGLDMADRALAGLRCVRRHPLWWLGVAVGAGAGVAIWRPQGVTQGVTSWVQRGLAAWRLWQRVQPLVMPLMGLMAAGQRVPEDELGAPPPVPSPAQARVPGADGASA